MIMVAICIVIIEITYYCDILNQYLARLTDKY